MTSQGTQSKRTKYTETANLVTNPAIAQEIKEKLAVFEGIMSQDDTLLFGCLQEVIALVDKPTDFNHFFTEEARKPGSDTRNLIESARNKLVLMDKGDAAIVITAAVALAGPTLEKFTQKFELLSKSYRDDIKDFLLVTFETFLDIPESDAAWIIDNFDHLNAGSAMLFNNMHNIRL